MVWIPAQNGRQSLAEDNLPVDTVRQEKRKIATIIERSDGLHEKKHGRRYDRRQTSLAFQNGQTALSCIYYNNNKSLNMLNSDILNIMIINQHFYRFYQPSALSCSEGRLLDVELVVKMQPDKTKWHEMQNIILIQSLCNEYFMS